MPLTVPQTFASAEGSQAPSSLFRGGNWSDLTLIGTAGPTNGTDPLGDHIRVDFQWALAGTADTVWETAILVFPDVGVDVGTGLLDGLVIFEQTFSAGIVSTGKVGADHPQSMWPAFADHPAEASSVPALGFLSFRGVMSGGVVAGTFGDGGDSAGVAATTAVGLASATEQSNLLVERCGSSSNQSWKFLSGGSSSSGGLLENVGNRRCLQLGHCALDDSAKVAADVACKPVSMCDGKNLEWQHTAKTGTLVSLLSGKCVTVSATTGAVTQAECGGGMSSDQNFSFDAAAGHLAISATGLCLTVDGRHRNRRRHPPPPPRRRARAGAGSRADRSQFSTRPATRCCSAQPRSSCRP